MAAHKVDGWEGEAVLTVRTIVGQEWLGSCLQFFELVATLLALPYIFAYYLSILFDVVMVLLESE
jgi:nicotinamide riboside transporter PnuC